MALFSLQHPESCMDFYPFLFLGERERERGIRGLKEKERGGGGGERVI
jgi:hypothetical protein